MFLTGWRIAKERIVLPERVEALQPAGIDLTVDYIEEFSEPGFLGENERVIPRGSRVGGDTTYELPPGAYRVRFREVVEVPPWAIGLCLPRSSLLRMGAAVHCAVWDPGYRGRGAALLVVYNSHGIRVERGARVAQLVVARLEELPRTLYSGAYQGEGLS